MVKLFNSYSRQSGAFFAATLSLSIFSWEAVAQTEMITFDEVKQISPKALDEFAQAIADADADFADAGITTRLRMAHFLSQVMTETGGLSRLDENMAYSFKSLMRVFSRKTVSAAKAHAIAGDPRAVANWVYGARLGNQGRNTDDGWTYRGSGFIQLTGRQNFRARGNDIGFPLEESPELARQAREGLLAAIAYWKASNINAAADDNDPVRVRILVNGPKAHGLDQSKLWFSRAWNRVFRDKPPAALESVQAVIPDAPVNEKAAFEQILMQSGLLSHDFQTNPNKDALLAAAVKEFQQEVGLPETGELDAATLDELHHPREWRHRDEADAAPPRLELELEQTTAFKLASSVVAREGVVVPDHLAPNTGTGQTVSDVDRYPEDIRASRDAKAIYPNYEMVTSTAGPDAFRSAGVIGEDSRVVGSDAVQFPARAIVQITFDPGDGSQRLCTGAMVAESTVLTAAHCIHSGTTVGHSYGDFRVTPGTQGSSAPFGRCHAQEAFVLTGWTASVTADQSRNYDLGALKLDCKVGEATGWLGVRAVGDEEIGLRTMVEGYTADLAQIARRWVSDDSIRLIQDFKGFYQNDSSGGTNGAPVVEGGIKDVLIGVHTNGPFGTDEPWASNSAFTKITPERLARIREWIDR